MAIIQISKIQQRSGNLVDLPQLDEAEFGWASDEKRLFIGKSVPNENVEVLTSYSNVSFSQVVGSGGSNLNITGPLDGQVLSYVASTNTWDNKGSTAGGLIDLGDVSNVKIGGGAISYVLGTDGTGNLAWTSKGTIVANIIALSNATPIVMRVATSIPYTNGTGVTISGVNGAANSNVNSQVFYVKVSGDFPTSGNVSLYTSSDLAAGNAAIGTGLTYTNSPNGIATATIGGSTATAANGSTYSVQFNNGGILTGDSNITWDFNNRIFSVNGNANVSNLNASNGVFASTLNSNIATGTAPLTVISTTRVANLDVAKAGVANTVNDAAQPNITSTGTLASLSVSGNANVGNLGTTGVYATTLSASGNANVGNLGTAGLITAIGTVTGGNLETGGTLSAVGNANVGNLGTAGLITAIGTVTGGNLETGGTLSAGGNANVGNLGTTGVYATTLSASGNANVGNLGTAGLITATGNITTSAQLVSSVATGTAPLSVSSSTRVTNLNVDYANVSEYETVTSASTGTYYPTFVNNSTTGNRALAANASFSANLANGGFTATTFIGTLSGNITTTEITTGANTTQGNITGNWVLTAGSKMQATYADLAEYYEADQKYEPGTVLEFGGDKEVTLAQDGTTRVAGVVSTDPAYVMNAGCPGHAVAIALQGRVPCKVRGKVCKGDMMVSGGNGYARPWNNPHFGMVIGKSLENFEGAEGIIEIAVGRL